MFFVCSQIHHTNGLWYSAEYSTFSISDEVGKYRLTVAGYSGDAGDPLRVTYVLELVQSQRANVQHSR